MKTNNIVTLVLLALGLGVYALWQKPARGTVSPFAPTAYYDTCYKKAARSLITAGTLTLAGDTVPTDRLRVRRHLQQELAGYIYYPAQTRMMAARARRYFRIIDPILKHYHIPRDFRYVVAVESMCDNAAVSRRGATGLWQLMAAPAREMGLRLDSEVDERLNPERATDAACRYIRSMHRQTGSWTATLAAYNCGINRWVRTTTRAGHADYYRMWMNGETSRYVYKVLAFKEIMERPLAYGLDPHPRALGWPGSRRVRVSKPTTLAALANEQATDVESLRTLNPWLVGNTITPPATKAYVILVALHPPAPAPRLAQAELDSLPKIQVFFAADSVQGPGLL